MDKIKELENKIKKLRWLEEIADSYRKMIKTIKENEETFTVSHIVYMTCGDPQRFNVSPYKDVLTRYVKEGLSVSLKSIEDEIEKLKKEIVGT